MAHVPVRKQVLIFLNKLTENKMCLIIIFSFTMNQSLFNDPMTHSRVLYPDLKRKVLFQVM